jgi:O-antigen ligase
MRNVSITTDFPLHERTSGRTVLLLCAAAVSLVGVLAVAGGRSEIYPAIGIVVAVAPWILVAAIRWPAFHYGVLFALFVYAAGNAAGVGIPEVAFGVYYIPFLAWWYISRLAIYHEPIIRQQGDIAILVFLALLPVFAVYGLLAGGKPSIAISELASFGLLAFYFPFREFCEREPHGRRWLIGFLIAIGIIATLRNFVTLASVFAASPDLRGIAFGRATQAEVLIFTSSVAAATGMLFVRKKAHIVLATGCFLVCSLGVLVTQYRSYYLGLVVALGVLFLVSSRPMRIRLTAIVVGSGIIAVGVAVLVLGDLALLILGGLFERAASIGTASEQDISFINRFNEYAVVVQLIINSPIIGHGLGSEFGFYDAIFNFTWVKPYVHNGFLHLLYKMGIVGFALMGYIVVVALARGWKAARHAHDPDVRLGAAFAVAMIIGLGVAATATVLYNTDMMLPMTLALALCASVRSPQQSE